MYAVVDCNSFFASCEQVFRPDLTSKPVVVLSSNDGCVVARSAEAKRLGIPMGAPYFKHRETMEQHKVAVFSANFHLYGDFSRRILSILDQTGVAVEPYSVDEAFLRLADLARSDYKAWARALRVRILRWTGLPVSVGIGPTKTLAKAGSELAKRQPKSGGVVDLQNKAAERLGELPVEDVWGIGFRLSPKLWRLGIRTAADLLQLSEGWMRSFAGVTGVRLLKELRGEDVFGWRVTYNEPSRHTIAATRSFGRTVIDLDELRSAVASFVVRASYRLRRQGKLAGKVYVFATTGKHARQPGRISAQRSLPYPSADSGLIMEEALAALESVYRPDYGYKRAGITLLDLAERQAQQLPLLPPADEGQLRRRERLMRTFDAVRDRYGEPGLAYAVQAPRQWQSSRRRLSPRYTTSWQDLPTVKI